MPERICEWIRDSSSKDRWTLWVLWGSWWYAAWPHRLWHHQQEDPAANVAGGRPHLCQSSWHGSGSWNSHRRIPERLQEPTLQNSLPSGEGGSVNRVQHPKKNFTKLRRSKGQPQQGKGSNCSRCEASTSLRSASSKTMNDTIVRRRDTLQLCAGRNWNPRDEPKHEQAHSVNKEDDNEEAYTMYHIISSKSTKPVMVNVMVSGQQTEP